MLKFHCMVPKLGLLLNGVTFGKNMRMVGWPFIFRFPKAEIQIGKHAVINSGFFSNLLGLYQRTIMVAKNNGKIHIGDYVSISGATIYCWESITIGNHTNIGANVKIIDTDFHPVDPLKRMQADHTSALRSPVVIGNNVFIGMNSIILKGTTIGDHCVIGAGSVVHGNFADHTMIAGNPAKVIRKI